MPCLWWLQMIGLPLATLLPESSQRRASFTLIPIFFSVPISVIYLAHVNDAM